MRPWVRQVFIVVVILAPDGDGSAAQTIRTVPVQHATTRSPVKQVKTNQAPVNSRATSVPTAGSRPFLALQLGHSDAINCLAFSPDGRTLATGGKDNRVILWDMPSGQVKMILPHSDGVSSLAFSPDGKVLATGLGQIAVSLGALANPTVTLWDTSSGQLKALFKDAMGPVAFSPDGTTLATWSTWVERISLWNVRTERIKAQIKLGDHGESGIRAIAFSPDGKTLAVGGSILQLYDLASAQPKVTLQGHITQINALVFSPDGKTLFTAGGMREIRKSAQRVDGEWHSECLLWDVVHGRLGATLHGVSERPIQSVVLSKDGRTLAIGGSDLQLWDVKERRLIVDLPGHPSKLYHGH